MAKKVDIINTDFDQLLTFVPKGQRWEKYRHGIKIDHASPWKFAARLLKKYTNKSFADGFSEFCNKVPKHMQYIFLDEFQNYEPTRWGGRYYSNYYIDDKNIIRCLKDFNRYKGPYYFRSIDIEYQTVWKNKITESVWKEPTNKNRYVIPPWDYDKNPKNKKPNWESIVTVIKGYELKFKSKKDPLFVRLKAEKKKIMAAMHRASKKQNIKDWDATLKFYSKKLEDKLEKAEMTELQRRKKEEQENLVKIISHGFDPVTSFRTPAKGFSGGGK